MPSAVMLALQLFAADQTVCRTALNGPTPRPYSDGHLKGTTDFHENWQRFQSEVRSRHPAQATATFRSRFETGVAPGSGVFEPADTYFWDSRFHDAFLSYYQLAFCGTSTILNPMAFDSPAAKDYGDGLRLAAIGEYAAARQFFARYSDDENFLFPRIALGELDWISGAREAALDGWLQASIAYGPATPDGPPNPENIEAFRMYLFGRNPGSSTRPLRVPQHFKWSARGPNSDVIQHGQECNLGPSLFPNSSRSPAPVAIPGSFDVDVGYPVRGYLAPYDAEVDLVPTFFGRFSLDGKPDAIGPLRSEIIPSVRASVVDEPDGSHVRVTFSTDDYTIPGKYVIVVQFTYGNKGCEKQVRRATGSVTILPKHGV